MLIWGSRGAAKSRSGSVAAPSSLLLSSPEDLTSSKAFHTSLCLSLGIKEKKNIFHYNSTCPNSFCGRCNLPLTQPPCLLTPPLLLATTVTSQFFPHIFTFCPCSSSSIMPLVCKVNNLTYAHTLTVAGWTVKWVLRGTFKFLHSCVVPPRHDVITHDHLLLFLPSSLSCAPFHSLLMSPQLWLIYYLIPRSHLHARKSLVPSFLSFFCGTSLCSPLALPLCAAAFRGARWLFTVPSNYRLSRNRK